MDKIYEDYTDLHVAASVIYKKANDAYAYSDSATTEKIDADTLKDLFEKGVVVIDSTIEYKPVSFGISATVGTLTYVKTDGSTPTTAVLATLKSEEYSA